MEITLSEQHKEKKRIKDYIEFKGSLGQHQTY